MRWWSCSKHHKAILVISKPPMRWWRTHWAMKCLKAFSKPPMRWWSHYAMSSSNTCISKPPMRWWRGIIPQKFELWHGLEDKSPILPSFFDHGITIWFYYKFLISAKRGVLYPLFGSLVMTSLITLLPQWHSDVVTHTIHAIRIKHSWYRFISGLL